MISRGSGEVAEILQRSQADMNAIAGRIQGIGAEYQALGNEFKLGNGDGAAPGAEPGEEPQLAVGDENEPWTIRSTRPHR